jgi:hypothetical protein
VLVPFHQQQRWGGDAFSMDVSPRRRDRFVFAAFNTILRYLLEDPATFLPPSTFPFTSSSQPDYLLFSAPVVMVATKAVDIISAVVKKINTPAIDCKKVSDSTK